MLTQIDLTLADTPFAPGSTRKEVLYRPLESNQASALYKVWLFLTGPDLAFVTRVTYVLHPTFPTPRRTVERTLKNQNCRFAMWTWGVFEVKAIVGTADGASFELRHDLEYTRHFKDAGVIFIEDTPVPLPA